MTGEKRKRIELINLQEVLKGRKRNVNKEKVIVKKTKSKPIKNSKSAIKTATTTNTTATAATKGQTKTLKTTTKTKPIIENESIKETDDIDYSENYNLEKGYRLNGSAQIISYKEGGDMIFQLTPLSQGQVGSVWSTKKVTIDKGFQCEFTFNVSARGADGFAFILQRNGINEIERGGGELGYNQIANGVIAIEFDTYRNGEMGDPYGNHISIQRPTPNQRLSTNHQYSLGSYCLNEINDGLDKHVKIIYNSEKKEIETHINGKIILQGIKVPYSFPKYAYFGFTGSTGCEQQIHQIKGCRFSSI
ncbi:hypothetical protein ACTFIY_003356 [Dictyostelium cf. discoideum]